MIHVHETIAAGRLFPPLNNSDWIAAYCAIQSGVFRHKLRHGRKKPVDMAENTDRNLGCVNGPKSDKGKYRTGPIGKGRNGEHGAISNLNTATALTVSRLGPLKPLRYLPIGPLRYFPL